MKTTAAIFGVILMAGPVYAQCDPGEKTIRFATDEDTIREARIRAVNLLRSTVNKEMQGKACIQVISDDARFKGSFAVTALQEAQVELAAPSFREFGGFASEYGVFDLPFAFRDIHALERFQKSASGQLSTAVSTNGVVPLGFWHGHFQQMAAKVPIYSPANVAGVKFRKDDAAFFSAQISALNAISITVAKNGVSEALKTARISGLVSNWQQLLTDKTAELANGVTETNHTFVGYQLVASSAWWSGLDPAFAKQIKEIIERTTLQSNFDDAARETNAKRAIMRSGIAVRALTRKQRQVWREKLSQIWDDYSRSNRRLIELVKASNIGL